MDPKKMIGRIGKYALLKQAADKIAPMDGDKPKLGWKAKVAGIFAAIAVAAGAMSQFLGG
jgi:hypothetical protein